MTQHLFVYGTLAPGRANAHILADVPGIWEPASVRGTLYPEGWGAALGYPGLVLEEDGVEVQGLVFSSDVLDGHWTRLDEFEGDGYRRRVTHARLHDGTLQSVYFYALSEHPAAAK